MIELMAAFAVWRLTYMLHAEDGPGHIFRKFRSIFIEYGQIERAKNWIGEMLECFYCTSVWCSLPVAVYLAYLTDLRYILVYWLGLSGLSIMIEVLRRNWADNGVSE